MGYSVIQHTGLLDLPHADVLFLHIDRTVLPDEYVARTAEYPVVINGRAVDISRHRYSMARLSQNDGYDGPVIIKTNANYGGLPERRGQAERRSPLARLARHAARIWPGTQWAENTGSIDWSTVDHLNPRHYPILENPGEVPAEVWNNTHLVVEKFLPEREGEFFYVRYWTFLGDQSMSGRYGSRHPIVKFGGMATPDTFVEPPPELRQWRERLGLDYGRLDYVMHEGKPILLDANKTLGGGDSIMAYRNRFDILATGIAAYLS